MLRLFIRAARLAKLASQFGSSDVRVAAQRFVCACVSVAFMFNHLAAGHAQQYLGGAASSPAGWLAAGRWAWLAR